ncbi:cleavage and polyadenylation specificity factor subunit [Anaeramoeba flamelloides]|uniref:Cleavage and polyadenylation specificity factor subunit 2 n=1 Tax=Anaeramoeba flamelloides TaxID=1746091 RepID=A0AAV7Z132_9EUKA|nr:cleavage and polyadenylation specificity factor subunit [Anaeramoeba flamelloides]
MSCFIHFTPLYGSYSEGPICYLLDIDDFTIMLDCGWSEEFDTEDLSVLNSYINKIDLVLLSHSDLAHIGALPYLICKLGLKAPVYSTLPVALMGKLTLEEVLISVLQERAFDLFTFEDILQAFKQINLLKFSQQFDLTEQGAAITITPLAAGHSLGGSIWFIKKEAERIIYAVDWNHARDRHLSSSMLSQIKKPSLLITDSRNFLIANKKRNQRDRDLSGSVIQTLTNGGSVLMPTDVSNRVLELLLFLETLWENQQYEKFSLVFVGYRSRNVLLSAQSMIEWMGSGITKMFDSNQRNPFDFKHVKICTTLKQFEKLPLGPKVICCTLNSLEYGWSRDFFLSFCEKSLNLVLFTSRDVPGSFNRFLIDQSPISSSSHKQIKLKVRQRVELEGSELEQYLLEEKILKQQEENANKAMDFEYAGEYQDVKDEEEAFIKLKEIEEEERVQEKTLISDEVLGTDILTWYKKNQNNNLRRVHFAMFPNISEYMVSDQYGEIINNSEFPTSNLDDDISQIKNKNENTCILTLPLRKDLNRYINDEKKSESNEDGKFNEMGTNQGTSSGKNNNTSSDNNAGGMEIEKKGGIGMFGLFDDRSRTLEQQKINQDPEYVLKSKIQDDLPFDNDKPIKYVEKEIYIELNCEVKYIDIEGRSDGEAIRNILPKIEPRNVIIIHGSKKSTTSFRDFCLRKITPHVYNPKNEQKIDVSTYEKMIQVQFQDDFLQGIKFKKKGEFGISYMDSIVELPQNSNIPTLVHRESDNEEARDPIFLGNMQLPILKKKLLEQSIDSQWVEGSLIFKGVIAIKKKDNEITIEGDISEDNYKIREIIYSQYGII